MAKCRIVVIAGLTRNPLNINEIAGDCALNAGADCIVTNDKHFNVLKDIDFPKINIVDIDTFKQIISGL